MASAIEVIAVREAGGGLRDDLRAVRVVWRRELLRFRRNRLRIITSLMQPVLLSYAVDPMRRAVFQHVHTPASFQHQLNPGISWGDWRLPVGLELLLVAAAGALMLALAVKQFNHTE